MEIESRSFDKPAELSATTNGLPDWVSSLPIQVEIVEVGPRDGLQTVSIPIDTADKISLIKDLVAAGLRRIQVASFVHPKIVPQMADAEEVCAGIPRQDNVHYSGLALNLKGVERAYHAGLAQVDISLSASDAHSRRNANRSIEEALVEFQRMHELARSLGMKVRGGIQCAFGYEQAGDVHPEMVITLTRRILVLGLDEYSLADSAGLANPGAIVSLLNRIMPLVADTPLVLHLHDTRGMGLANVLAALSCGVNIFDTAFGGLGGCPFIDGAAGNIATEDTVFMLAEMGIQTGVNLNRLASISRQFALKLGHALPGKVYPLVT